MKRFLKSIIVIFVMGIISSCGTYSQIDKYTTEKVAKMKQLVGFSEEKAVELKRAEIKYSKALMASCGNDEKQKELKEKRKIWLHNILGYEKSLKYLELEKIKEKCTY